VEKHLNLSSVLRLVVVASLVLAFHGHYVFLTRFFFLIFAVSWFWLVGSGGDGTAERNEGESQGR
jgi:hypothetical protein